MMSNRLVYALTFCFSFSLGFFLYLAIETLYKRQFTASPTHFTMGLIAGLAFVFLLFLDKTAMRFLYKAALGAVFITVLEFLFGLYLNLYRGLGIWDYSRMPFHVLGQICPAFSLVWFGFSCLVIFINRFLLTEVRFLCGAR